MITPLKNMFNAINKQMVTPEEWQEWEHNKVTKHFKAEMMEQMIHYMANICGCDKKRLRYYQGNLDSLDHAINYKPEDSDV